MIRKAGLNKLLTGAQLPALPDSAIRLIELSQDLDNNGPSEFAVPIEADPGLTGQVLQYVNSSYFGFSNEIASVKLAITLVGIRTIKNFALWSAVFSLMPNPRCGLFDLKGLRQDSLRRGIFARALGKSLGIEDTEELFAAALLQDMAIPLLARELPDPYSQLLTARDAGNARLSQLEQERFGWTHAEAAARMVRGWKLPEAFASLIEAHVDWDKWVRKPDANLGKLAVSLSSMLPAACDHTWIERTAFVEAYSQLPQVDAARIVDVLEGVDRQFKEFAPVLNISAPQRSLVEHLERESTAQA